jgi:CelD/BcsL family acetyltransferase involved in cellulose biosynthesis
MALESKLIRDATALAQFEPAWRELLARSSSDEPTLSPLWLSTWWRVFGQDGGRHLHFVLFLEGVRLVGIAPLLARRHWYVPGIPFRRLEWLASGEPEAEEIGSDYLGVIAEHGKEEAVVRAFAAALVQGELGPWDELVLPAMNAESPTAPLFARALTEAGVATTCETTTSCPYIALPATFEHYLASLTSAGRYLVTRSLRDLDEWAKGDLELHVARNLTELDQGKRILKRLHGERWGAEGRSGVFGSPRFAAFHDAVMPLLLAAGALELLWLTVRGDPIAIAYNIVWNGKVYFYQSGRKIDVPKGVRPGIVIHAHAIRRAIAAGRREYDFLAGASRYKVQLATASRSLVRVRAVRSPRLELAHSTAVRGLDTARRLRDQLRALGAHPRQLDEPR